MSKLYQSQRWLTRQYVALKKKPEEIADEQGVTKMTIYNYLRKFGLLK
jgi:predicted transcriptional regulator